MPAGRAHCAPLKPRFARGAEESGWCSVVPQVYVARGPFRLSEDSNLMPSSTQDPPAAPADAPAPSVHFLKRAGSERGWRITLREFVVIGTSVLAALAAQAWWDNGQERERERDYLH